MITTTALALVLLGTQDSMTPPFPKAELDAIKFLTGNYRGKGTSHDQAGNIVKTTGSSQGRMEFGHWLSMNADYTMPGTPKMNGRFMLTYNMMSQKYEGTWFDNMTQQPLNCKGKFEGEYLVLWSDPMTIAPGVPPAIFKIVYRKSGARSYDFRLRIKMADQWSPVMDMSYTR